MKNSFKLGIKQIIGLILVVLIVYGFFSLGGYIEMKGKPIVTFCNEHYKNKTFLETTTFFTENDPSTPLVCIDNIHNPYPYSNPDMKKCLEDNATKEQVYFMQNCHWMGLDYLTLAGTVAFKYVIPLGLLAIIIAGLFQKENENDERHI